jgi:hypothetical protein
MAKNTERKAVDKVFILLGSAMTAVLLVIGVLAWYGHTFASDMVRDQLSAQKIYFPEQESEAFKALSSEDQVEIGRFAGQQLTTGEQAKVYANNYIGAHLKKIGGGKTYAEISEQAMADPTNATLQQQKTTLFQGETLRGMLLGTGYAFWTFGMIAQYVAYAAFAGALLMAILVMLGLQHLARIK